MHSRIPAILRTVAATPWAIDETKLDAICELLEHRANGGTYSADEIAARIGAPVRPAATSRSGGGIAVLPIYGVIGQRMNMLGDISGGTSTESIGAQFDAAMRDDAVSAIVLDIDSPGGTVAGIPELAAKIHAARGQGKQVIAVANSMAASAAYWIASAADSIVVTPSGEVGSIGVFRVHTDLTKALDEAGVKKTVIRAGKYKAEGLPFEPLGDEARAAMQSDVDEYYGQFIDAVAAHRGISSAQVKAGYGEGRTLSAKRALSAGMVDQVATLDDVLSQLGAPKGARQAAKRAEHPAHATAIPAGSPEATRGEAPSLVQVIPLAPAPQAKEITVSDENTAAPGAVAPVPAAPQSLAAHGTPAPSPAEYVAAERARASQIRALAKEHNVAATTVESWLENGASVSSVKAAILDEGTARRAASPAISNVHDRRVNEPFGNMGDFAMAVQRAYAPGGDTDVRLAAATGMSQAIPSEGGFLVPAQFSQKIWDGLQQDSDNLLAMTDNYTIEGESLTFPANAETSRANGSRWGGVQSYWINEADQLTKSKPKFRNLKLEPQQMGVLVYVTEKLLRNAPIALEQYLTRAAGAEIDFKTGDSIVNGDGVGKPLGFLNSGALITVAKETSQAASTVLSQNISKMWSRLHPRARKSAVWFLNAETEPMLDELNAVVKNVAGTENVGGYAPKVYDAEKGTLKGRPIKVIEYAPAGSAAGDLSLVDLSSYATGTRGGIDTAISMHVRFEYAEQAFRFIYEVDGQPWLASALTPFKGTATQSTHIALGAR